MKSLRRGALKAQKALVLVSSGIDSAVAAYLIKEEGWDIEYLHFNKNTGKKVAKLIKILSGEKFYTLEHKELMNRILPLNPGRYMCVYCKAAMLFTAEKLAEKVGCSIIVTGDSLGQVASQTVLNMKSEESVVSMPVIRPLIGLDKEEIVEIAREIGTYEITKGGDLCPYAPKHPVTSGCDVDVKGLKNALSGIEDCIKVKKVV